MPMEKAEYLSPSQQIVKNQHDSEISEGQYELLVFWEDWPDLEDRIPEPHSSLQEDLPRMEEYFQGPKNQISSEEF